MTKLEYPFTTAALKPLKVGDMVALSGLVFTGRDRLHKYLFEGGKSPVDLKDSAMFHCGPVVIRKDGKWVIRAAGPTTSARQDPYMARIIEQHRVQVIIGKGGMGEATRRACIKHGCVYLQAVGGAAALLAKSIQEVIGAHFLREFGMAEALWELTVKDLPAVVAIDTRGQSLYKRVQNASRRALREALAMTRASDEPKERATTDHTDGRG